ncbi:DUF2635 domain-containing protein [Enterobacter asburiae]|uniref:DUF2635 domain-containing protein n=1 Tax=Enterobacter cloacae complex TaxID=354276 RepID=UPI001C1A9EB9|nr:DUF2635 domain-containing protein [Enterobacter hormaechei]MCM8191360.1 DUF2635 domain-containing protein [Enterobacter hormaechei]MDF3724774.1 DUF2635 domain-containing protein [Enterobacter hormaechei]HAS1825857.1 DUF2635 domain-containing protein [Enterobacter hormaechei subsp. xiangfangensis]HBM2810301.1 DUF2635 domain-containing protein [Enterobacter hormaechei subsp. xiangfangensis]
MFVKPIKGQSVPDPARGDVLPEKGRNVEASAYWFRRIAAGEIEVIQPKGAKDDRKL